MACKVMYGVALNQRWAQCCHGFILGVLEVVALQSFKFDANGVVIAVATASEVRDTCMPGPVIATYKLPDLAGASNIEMGRYLKAFNLFEIGMGRPIQLVDEQGLHGITAIHARWQTDGMQDDEVNLDQRRSGTKIR